MKKNVENFYNIRDIEIEVNTETNDKRSYHVNSEKITRVLGFRPKFSIDDAVISLCQGAFGLAGEPNKPVPFLDPDGEILIKMADTLVDGGRLAVSAFSAYFQMHYLENSKDTFYADHGVNHENASIRNMCGEEISQELWTSCFTPRELRLFAKDANLSVENIWSVAPGKYKRSRPTHTKPELLMIARRENYS